MFSYGEFKQEDQEKMLSQLNKKVEEVYRSCIGDNEANIRLVNKSLCFISSVYSMHALVNVTVCSYWIILHYIELNNVEKRLKVNGSSNVFIIAKAIPSESRFFNSKFLFYSLKMDKQ